MRILIVHQFLWSHYKAKIFSALNDLIKSETTIDLKVLQIAKNEKTRSNLGDIDLSIHQYDYELLFEDYYENTKFWNRVVETMKWVFRFKPDVINLPGYYEPAMVLVMFICKIIGIKVILAIDSTEQDNNNIWWKERLKRFIIGKADGFFCYGTRSAEYMVKLGADDNKNFVKNNAVDNTLVSHIYTEAYKNREEDKNVLNLPRWNFMYVGRLMELKNLTRLLTAYNTLKSEDWGLIIMGDGSEEQKLKNQVQEENIQNVTFLPSTGWREVPKKMILGDIFILSSFSEAWGLVVNEAMICGMPVIVSDKCGCAVDLVHENKNGFIFDTYSADDLASKMRFFADNTDKIEEYGLNSIEIIKKFSPEIVAQKMLDGFKKSLEKL